MIEGVNTAVHDVHGDTAQVNQRQQSLFRPSDDIMDDFFRGLGRNGPGAYTRGKSLGKIFLEETLAFHAIGATFGRERMILQPGKEARSDGGIVLNHVELGDLLFRPPDFVGMGDVNPPTLTVSSDSSFRLRAPLLLFTFPPLALRWLLIIPEAEKCRLAQFSILRPFGEGDLGNQSGSNPGRLSLPGGGSKGDLDVSSGLIFSRVLREPFPCNRFPLCPCSGVALRRTARQEGRQNESDGRPAGYSPQ